MSLEFNRNRLLNALTMVSLQMSRLQSTAAPTGLVWCGWAALLQERVADCLILFSKAQHNVLRYYLLTYFFYITIIIAWAYNLYMLGSVWPKQSRSFDNLVIMLSVEMATVLQHITHTTFMTVTLYRYHVMMQSGTISQTTINWCKCSTHVIVQYHEVKLHVCSFRLYMFVKW